MTVLRVDGAEVSPCQDEVIEEIPVALVFNGISHAVLLATPSDLEDLALLHFTQLGYECIHGPDIAPDEPAAEVLYRRATVSPRRRLLQRFSVNPDGIRFLVDLRAEMQPFLKSDKRLYARIMELHAARQ